jgi:phage gp46-like protein
MDIALAFDPNAKAFDLAVADGDLATDEGLETAVLLSLYTDRRALPEDELPNDGTDRRGWWCDAYSDRPHGSRLWLLSREKETDRVLRRAEEYAREALDWLVVAGIATVEVEAVHLRRGVLLLILGIQRPGRARLERRYEYVWGVNNGI